MKNNIQLSSYREGVDLIKRNLYFLLPLLIIVSIIYANSINGDFVSDDVSQFVNNQEIRNLTKTLKTLNFQNIYFSVSYKLFGLNPIPLHLTSLALHLASITLAFIFLSTLLPQKTVKLATILFALHPINSETVIWISANGYSYRTILLLLGLIWYSIYKNTKSNIYLNLSLSILPFAIITRSLQGGQALIIPAIYIIADQLFYQKKINPKSLTKLWPLLPVIAVFLFLNLGGISERVQTTTANFDADYSYIKEFFYYIFISLKLYVFPKDLTFYHDGELFTQAHLMFMGFVTTIFLLGVIFTAKKNPKISGLLLFIPTSIYYILTPFKFSWFIAERYLYTGTLAFAALLALGIIQLEKKFKLKNFAILATVTIAILYSVRILYRTDDWKNRKNLWLATQKVVPGNVRVYNNLGDTFAQEGNFEESIRYYTIGMGLDPNFAELPHNLGNTYALMGDYDTAIHYFKKSIEIKSTLVSGYYHIALAEFYRNNYEEALLYANKAIEADPSSELAQKVKEYINNQINQLR